MLHNYVAHYCELIISCPFDCALIEFIMPTGVLGLFFRLGCKRRLLLVSYARQEQRWNASQIKNSLLCQTCKGLERLLK